MSKVWRAFEVCDVEFVFVRKHLDSSRFDRSIYICMLFVRVLRVDFQLVNLKSYHSFQGRSIDEPYPYKTWFSMRIPVLNKLFYTDRRIAKQWAFVYHIIIYKVNSEH